MSTSDPEVASSKNSAPTSSSEVNPSCFSTLLASGSPLILDGALATYLETLGADISGDLWSASLLLDQPELIYRTHLDYYRAGAHIAITSSYQASIPGLTKHLSLPPSQAHDIVQSTVALAIRARTDYLSSITDVKEKHRKRERLLVAGSVGPYGAFLADGSEYRGDYVLSKDEFKDFHRERIAALVSAGADLLAIETIPSYAETQALVELLEQEFADAEVWFSFTLRDSSHISDGNPLTTVIELLETSKQTVALGVNCVPESDVLAALKVLKGLTSKPLVVYPNSGEVWNAESRSWTGERKEGEGLAERVKEWYAAGARMIGGCCRTTPADISTVEQALKDVST